MIVNLQFVSMEESVPTKWMITCVIVVQDGVARTAHSVSFILFFTFFFFSILDHTSTTLQFKIKEGIHIQWEQPILNLQLYHVNLKLSL